MSSGLDFSYRGSGWRSSRRDHAWGITSARWRSSTLWAYLPEEVIIDADDLGSTNASTGDPDQSNEVEMSQCS